MIMVPGNGFAAARLIMDGQNPGIQQRVCGQCA
jgi:hypothetical protein